MSTPNTSQTSPSGENETGVELTATVDKRVIHGQNRGWYFPLSDGTRSFAEYSTKKAAQDAAAACIAVRSMNAREDARRVRLRAFVHPGCERVRLDELAPGNRVWLVRAMAGTPGEMYPTWWDDIVIAKVEISTDGKSFLIWFRDPNHTPDQHPSCVPMPMNCEQATIGANRRVQTSSLAQVS